MKKNIIIWGFIFVFSLPISSLGATFEAVNEYTLPVGKTVSDNLYVLGKEIKLEGQTSGDVTSFGESVSFSGEGQKDVFLVGADVKTEGAVREDLRVAGGSVLVESVLGGDLIAVGFDVTVLPKTIVAGDVLIFGNDITVSGSFAKNVRLVGHTITINGLIGGNVTVISGSKLVLGPKAKISGDLTYKGSKEISMTEGQVMGRVTFDSSFKPPYNIDQTGHLFQSVIGFIALVKFIGTLIISFIFVFLFKKSSQEVVILSLGSFWKSVLWGFLLLVALPLLALLMIFSLIGSYLALLLIVFYFLILGVAGLLAGVVFGRFLRKLFSKKDGGVLDPTIDWKDVLLGVVFLRLLFFAPLVGPVIVFIFFCATLWGTFAYLRQRVWLDR